MRDSRTKGGGFKLTKGMDGASVAADFEIAYNRDYLFYRVLTYVDENGAALEGLDDQYVPYTVQDEKEHAAIKEAPAKEGYTFTGWLVEGKSTYPENRSFRIPAEQVAAGMVVADIDDVLAYGAVTLKAQYEKNAEPVVPEVKGDMGLLYLEFDAAGAVTGFSGMMGEKPVEPFLSGDSELASWGYYVVVPQGSPRPTATHIDSGSVLGRSRAVVLNGVTYDAYAATFPSYLVAAQSQKVVCTLGTSTYTYYCNVSFADAVTLDQDVAADWGDDAPWTVRHADQFINSLDASTLQPKFNQHSFVQTHDIDFAGRPNMLAASDFEGEYDGGGFSILNFDPSMMKTYNASWSGLFPSAKGAEFKRINLEVVSTSQPMSVNGDNGANVGLLVGSALDGCEFEDCAVRGAPSERGAATVNVTVPTWADCNVGGLVGRGEGVEIERCVVSDVAINILATYSEKKLVSCGGLAGLLTGKSEIDVRDVASGPAVSNVRFSAQGAAQAHVGGMIGRGSPNMIKGGAGNTVFDKVMLRMNDDEVEAHDLIGYAR